MSSVSPSPSPSSPVSAFSSCQNRRPFSISSLLHSSQNSVSKCPPLGTSAVFSDALQQCLPMLFAARGIIGEGAKTETPTAGISTVQFNNTFQQRTKEEETNGDEVPTSEESSQSEDDGILAKVIEKIEMNEEEEAFEENELKVKQEQKQTKEEEEEEEKRHKDKETEGSRRGTTPEGCFVPWLFSVLPPPPSLHQSPSLFSPPTTARGPPLFPAPFIPAFLKSPFGLPAQFLLSNGTFPTACGPCAPQTAQQQQQHSQNKQHNHQQHQHGHHVHQQPHQHKRKGGQIRFSNEQTDILETTFDVKKYLNNAERKRLARALDLHERQVKTWFQNRRAKWRRQMPPEMENGREGEESISETMGGTALTTAAAAEQHNNQHHHHTAYELYMQRK